MELSSDALPSVADEETCNNNNAADESDDDSSDDEERVPTPEGNIPDGIDKEVWKELKRVDKFERTALHRLAEKGSGDTVTMLVTTFGADVDAKDCMGQTPIHYALRFNNQSFMTALAKCGANLKQQDIFGTVPMSAARDVDVRTFIQGLIDEQAASATDADASAPASAAANAESKQTGSDDEAATQEDESAVPGATSASSRGMEVENDTSLDDELAGSSHKDNASSSTLIESSAASGVAASEAEGTVDGTRGLTVSPIATSPDTGNDAQAQPTSLMESTTSTEGSTAAAAAVADDSAEADETTPDPAAVKSPSDA